MVDFIVGPREEKKKHVNFMQVKPTYWNGHESIFTVNFLLSHLSVFPAPYHRRGQHDTPFSISAKMAWLGTKHNPTSSQPPPTSGETCRASIGLYFGCWATRGPEIHGPGEGPFLRIFHNWCIGFGFWTVNCNCSPSSLHLTDMRCSPPDI